MSLRTRTLHHPDLHVFHGAAGYSPAVASALISAYAIVNANPRDVSFYERAKDLISTTLSKPMAKRQRVRVCFVLGMSLAATKDEYSDACLWLAEAIELARELAKDQTDPIGDSDLLDLLYLRGAVHRGISHCARMADDYREFLSRVEDRGQSPDAVEAPLTLAVRVQLAGAEFFLAHYIEASEILDTARDQLTAITSLGATPETLLIEGTLEWFQALIDRWRAAPSLALNSGARAAKVYRERGAPISAARVQLVVADIYLDLAMRETSEQARRQRAEYARPLITEGMRFIDESGDPVGNALAQLTEARWSRLAGLQEDRMGAIEEVAQLGHELDDVAILAQAYTALGDELRSQGRIEAGLSQYYNARSYVQDTQIPAMGVWAHRALLRRSEDELASN